MFSELYVAASGMVARQQQMEVLSHNLANLNSVGFKVEELLLEETRIQSSWGAFACPSQVRVAGRRTDFSPGELQMTGDPLDVALGSAGFFVVQSQDGIRFTRDGRFSLDAEGRLVLGGMPVLAEQGEIKAGRGVAVRIEPDGQVVSENGPVGRLRVVVPQNPSMMEKTGEGLYKAGDELQLQDDPNPRVFPGYLEVSNTNGVRCMVQIIEAVRGFEMHQRMLQVVDRLGEKAVQELGRTA